MRALGVLLALTLGPLFLAAAAGVAVFLVAMAREVGQPRPRHRAPAAPRRPQTGPGMPIPIWTRHEPPPPVLIPWTASDGHTQTLDPVAAEVDTEWPEHMRQRWPLHEEICP